MRRSLWRWIVLGVLSGCVAAVAEPEFTFDTQGDARWSQNNFTDLTESYNGLDGWAELKLNVWSSYTHALGPYLTVLPSYASEDLFWWQRNVTYGGGLQYYPFPENTNALYLSGLRTYAWAGWRDFYDVPADAVEPEDTDVRIGADYYYDTFSPHVTLVTPMVWLNVMYAKSNFALEDYEGVLTQGNVKLGHLSPVAGSAFVYPYVFTDWTWSPSYDERWWENFLRGGAGFAIYPFALISTDVQNEWGEGFLNRLHLYAEVAQNLAWLGDEAPDSVDETDYRVGIAVSTGTFLGKR